MQSLWKDTILIHARTAILLMIALYAISLDLLLVAKFFTGDSLPIIALGNTFLHLLLLFAIVPLAISLIGRQWLIALALLPPIGMFIVVYGVRFLPRATLPSTTASTAPSATTFKILTYNMHAESESLDGVLSVIRASNADIVAVQELSFPMADRFQQELSEIYPYQALHPMQYSNAGQAVLSRYPLSGDEYWRGSSLRSSLGNQRIQVDVNGKTVTLYNTHPRRPVLRGLSFDDSQRNNELGEILKRAVQDKQNGPVLMVGDFNMTDQTGDYQQIAAVFGDTYREVGWGLGPTFPDSNPATPPTNFIRRVVPFPLLLRLDYVFHSEHFQALEAHVWPESGGSDHRPLFARLKLRAG